MRKHLTRLIAVGLTLALTWTSGEAATVSAWLAQPSPALWTLPHVVRRATDPFYFTEQALVQRLLEPLHAPRRYNFGSLLTHSNIALAEKPEGDGNFWKVAGLITVVSVATYLGLPFAAAGVHALSVGLPWPALTASLLHLSSWLLTDWVAHVTVRLIFLSLAGVMTAHVLKDQPFGQWVADHYKDLDQIKLFHLLFKLPLLVYGFGFNPIVRLITFSLTGELPL